MSTKMIQVKGPKLTSVLTQVNKAGIAAIKKPIVENSKDIQRRARQIAVDFRKTGRYYRSIGRRTRAIRKEGEISATVGIRTSSDAMLYAWKLEHKYHVFTHLEHEFKQPVTRDVTKGLRDGMRMLKVR